MKIPSLDKTESMLLLGLVGIVLYGVWKASQVASEAYQGTVRWANDLGNTVSNAGGQFRTGAQDALYASSLPGTVSAAQAMAAWNSLTDAYDPANDVRDAGGEGIIDGSYSVVPDTFQQGSKRMMKPSYGRLSQPSSKYVA